MLEHPFLRSLILEHFVCEIQSIPEAILFPLGEKVESVIRKLYENRLISNPCAYGMLHPSGQNTYRLNYLFGGRNGDVPHKTNVAKYDKGRDYFLQTFLGT
jgi:hypothetical protein